MKFLATFSTIFVLLSLAPGSIGTDDGDTRSLLRTRELQGKRNNLFANTVSYSSEQPIVGRRLKPFASAILKKFQECVDDFEGEEVKCDIYFNPHTDYSFYRNPSAIGVLRGQLCYNGTSSSDGNTHYFSVPEATSEIMDDLMIDTGIQATGGVPECDEAKYTKLGPGIASAVAEVSWNNSTDDIILLSSTIVLKKVQTKDIRCKNCNVVVKGGPSVDGVGLTCTEKDDFKGNKASYSNVNIIGSHLHLGDSTVDGPPPVFFCKNAVNPLSPGKEAFVGGLGPGVCSDVYTED